jgi:uncharacterized membrane protein
VGRTLLKGPEAQIGAVEEAGMPTRVANIILGVWLVVSAFLWPHSPSQSTNTWVLGVLCASFALIALAVPKVRYLNTALAVWLFISAWVLPRVSAATVWNNVLVAIAIFLFSLAPSEQYERGRRPAHTLP